MDTIFYEFGWVEGEWERGFIFRNGDSIKRYEMAATAKVMGIFMRKMETRLPAPRENWSNPSTAK
jgi:hypothetical protein